MQILTRRINAQTKIVVRRMLPMPGEVLVQRGQVLEPLNVVARAQTPHRYRLIDVTRQLGQSNPDMSQVMLKAEGDKVTANEVIARTKGGLTLFQRPLRAPAAGRIAAIGPGWVLLETKRGMIEVQAFIHGIVSRIIPDRGVVIEASGTIIEAACGFGGEAYGPLKRLVNTPFDMVTAEAIDESLKNSIILAGRTITEETLRQAQAKQVRGVIVGSIDAALMRLDPPVKVRVVATEGFGDRPISPYTFGLLGTLVGEVSIRGRTPVLSRTAAPDMADNWPVILASSSKASTLAGLPAETKPEFKVGSRVRVTQGRFAGASGVVKALPNKAQPTPSGVVVPSAQVALAEGSPMIPLANLEQVV